MYMKNSVQMNTPLNKSLINYISFTKTIMKQYRGPRFVIKGVRKIFKE